MSDPGWRVAVLDAPGEERARAAVEGDGADAFEKRDGALVNTVDISFGPSSAGFDPHAVSVTTPSGNEYTARLESPPRVGEGDNLVLPEGNVEVGPDGEGAGGGPDGSAPDAPLDTLCKASVYVPEGSEVAPADTALVDGEEVPAGSIGAELTEGWNRVELLGRCRPAGGEGQE